MAEENTRSRGVVSKFNDQKGYGFIKPEDGTEDLFVHQSEIRSDGYRTLREGQVVEFMVALENDKTKAVDVTGPNGVPVDRVRGRDGGGYGGRNSGRGGYGFSDAGYGYNRRNGNGYRSGGGGGGAECYNCGTIGHLARDCDRMASGGGGGMVGSECYNCGRAGHFARDCERSAGGGGSGSSGCYTCGEPGHMARDCLQGGGGRGYGFGNRGGSGGRSFSRFSTGGNNCYNCGESGHFARECTNNA